MIRTIKVKAKRRKPYFVAGEIVKFDSKPHDNGPYTVEVTSGDNLFWHEFAGRVISSNNALVRVNNIGPFVRECFYVED